MAYSPVQNTFTDVSGYEKKHDEEVPLAINCEGRRTSITFGDKRES